MNDSGPGAGTIISHYRILSRLGAGGMGEVHLAEDTKLDRKVALKLLPAAFTPNADRLRGFVQEARAASALNHPNIITIYEVGEVDSAPFIAMEYVDGQTLRQQMASRRRCARLRWTRPPNPGFCRGSAPQESLIR